MSTRDEKEAEAGPAAASTDPWMRRWLGNLDSNQDKQSQSLLCYRYTIPQWFTQ